MDHYTLPTASLIGHADIDAEHQELIDILNLAHQALQLAEEPARDLVYPFLETLRDKMQTHFGHEEHEMARLGFPELKPHISHHALCFARLDEICASVAQDKRKPDRDLLDELFDMVVDDMIRADGGFKTFLESHEVRVRAPKRFAG